jgi:calmodulin
LPHDDAIIKIFSKLSSDNGKTILKKDAKKFTQLLSQNPSNKQINDALHELGLSGDSIVNLTFNDCKDLIWTVWSDSHVGVELRKAFNLIDKNHDGLIDAVEFKELMINYGESVTLGELDEMMKLFDRNHDGKLNYEG